MGVLLLRLSGPMQSWGASSRFVRRNTLTEPTKSGVIGMLASALGRSREDSISDLAALEFGVRADQPGQLMCDFQTERPMGGGKSMPLSYRYYLADAKFLAAIAGDDELLLQVDQALRNPCWPLYLGRRSCPPDAPVSMGVYAEYEDVRDALKHEPWVAAEWFRRQKRQKMHDLEVRCDARDGELGASQSDFPLSFSGEQRRYVSRPVLCFRVPLRELRSPIQADSGISAMGGNGDSRVKMPERHDPMGFF